MLKRNHKSGPTGSRRTGLAVAVALLIFGVLFPMAAAGAATTFVVDDNTIGSDAGDCTAGVTTHNTIQTAITAAAAGDTIFVCPATYLVTTDPGITVDKDVTITSGGAAGAVISGSSKNTTTSPGAVIQVTVDNVTIEKLTIDLGDTDTWTATSVGAKSLAVCLPDPAPATPPFQTTTGFFRAAAFSDARKRGPSFTPSMYMAMTCVSTSFAR